MEFSPTKKSINYITSAMVLTTSWSDSGIVGSSQINSGVYLFTIKSDNNLEWYCGTLPWNTTSGASTISDEFSEISLVKCGDGGIGSSIFARILRTASGAPKVQLSATSTLPNQTYSFVFRKLLD